jgi:hypothetical protein
VLSTVYLGSVVTDVAGSVYDSLKGRPVSTRQLASRTPVIDTMDTLRMGIFDITAAVFESGTYKSGMNKGESKSITRLIRGIDNTLSAGGDAFGIPYGSVSGQIQTFASPFMPAEREESADPYARFR